MRKTLLIFVCILLAITLASCAKYELVEKVDAIVVNKEYRKQQITTAVIPIYNGKTTIMVPRTIIHPERHYIKLRYKDIYKTIDNKELYNNTNIGDGVRVNYYKSSDKEKISYE